MYTYQKKKHKELNERVDISYGKTGAVSELLVCADLLRRGHEVFRSVSQDCSCDMVILSRDKFYRIEVRTGWILESGRIGFSHKKSDEGRYDIMAVVLRGRDIIYTPSLDVL